MSRATFYRKVKSISQLTPNDFIRLIRLKKAAELLRQKEYRVNEIAFIVGFKSSSYFSKCFFKQFGVLPKDFVK
jgi:AraC-like DNA-binding protein